MARTVRTARQELRRGFRVAREFSLYAAGVRRPPARRFVILSLARSGSSALAGLLDHLPDVRCDGEILGRALPFPERYVHARSAAKPCSVYGFKLLIGHVRYIQKFRDRENLVRRLHEDGFSVIHLTRSDRLAAAVSMLRAQRLGFHARPSGGSPPSREPIRIEVDQLKARFERMDGHTRFAERLLRNVPCVTVNYEADLADAAVHQRTIDRLCKALDLPPAPVLSPFEKIAGESLRDSVSNFDELDFALRDSRWADLFAPHRASEPSA